LDLNIEKGEALQKSPQNIPRGIGGWLIFVVIGLVATPLFNFHYVFNELMPFFEPENWIEFTTVGGDFYHPLFGTIVILELVYNISIPLLAIWLLILMYMKRTFFIKLMLIYLISSLVLGLLLGLITNNVTNSIFEIDTDSQFEFVKSILQMIISSAIWIPYFIVSKRVKNTFVK